MAPTPGFFDEIHYDSLPLFRSEKTQTNAVA